MYLWIIELQYVTYMGTSPYLEYPNFIGYIEVSIILNSLFINNLCLFDTPFSLKYKERCIFHIHGITNHSMNMKNEFCLYLH